MIPSPQTSRVQASPNIPTPQRSGQAPPLEPEASHGDTGASQASPAHQAARPGGLFDAIADGRPFPSVVHEAMAPDDQEIDRAKVIVQAFEDAESAGRDTVSLGSKLIDASVIKRALSTVELAMKVGKLPGDWRDVDSGEKPGAFRNGRTVEKGGG